MFELLNRFFIIISKPNIINFVMSIFKKPTTSIISMGIGYILVILFGIFIVYLDNIIPYISKMITSIIAAAKRIFAKHKIQNITGDYKLDKAIAAAGYAYDEKQDMFYSKMDTWQRQMGYCRLYDEAASPLGMVVDSEPIFFDFDDKKWLIEFWKGQYDLTSGAEVGVYTSQKRDIKIAGLFKGVFYDCANDKDMMPLNFILRKHGKTMLKRKALHWWLTGFKLGEFASPDDLTMEIQITLKNQVMLKAFIRGLKKTGYLKEEINIKENTVSLEFSKPKTKQPSTRTDRTDEIILSNSKKLCDIYTEITAPYDTLPEKTNAVKLKAPELYKHIINIGKNDKIFWNHDIIKKYLGGGSNDNAMDKLTSIFNNANRIPFNNSSKFVIMSDVHRGVGDRSDDFLKNKNLYLYALKKYYKDKFTYIELGDGDELWENRHLTKVVETYFDVYLLFKKFYEKDRLYFIYGNHDKAKQRPEYLENNLYEYYDESGDRYRNLLDGIKAHEALVLNHEESGGNIFLLHGHQVDFFNNKLWGLARFLSRYLWKPLEHLGIEDPTRPAKVYKKKLAVERKLTEWIMTNKHMVVAGHTHKPEFSNVELPPYFNSGSCVRKNGITAIEIENGTISLVRWSYKINNQNKTLVNKEILAGPVAIIDYIVKDYDNKKTTA